MLEFKPVRGVKIGLEDLKIPKGVGRKIESVVKTLPSLLGEDVKIFLFGGAVRNIIFKWLGHKIEEETDIDVLVETDQPIHKIVPLLSKDEKFQPLLIVSEDTIRVYIEDTPLDIKFTYLAQDTPFDFTVNAVLAPLPPLLAGEKVQVFATSLEDFEKRILKHIAPFDVYPFHMLRGIRLASALNLKLHHTTLNAYYKSAKAINTLNPQLVHRELAKALTQGVEQAVRLFYITTLALHFFPPLLRFAKTNKDEYVNSTLLAYHIARQFNPKKGNKEILKLVGKKLTTYTLAPQRPLLYCYITAAILLPLGEEEALKVLIEKNYFPAERGLILQCIASVRTPTPLHKLPLVYPFYIAYQNAVSSLKTKSV